MWILILCLILIISYFECPRCGRHGKGSAHPTTYVHTYCTKYETRNEQNSSPKMKLKLKQKIRQKTAEKVKVLYARNFQMMLLS